MSFVLDQCHRIDAQLNRLQLASLPTSTASTDREHSALARQQSGPQPTITPRVAALLAAVRGLSPSSSTKAILKPDQIETLLSALSTEPTADAAVTEGPEDSTPTSDYEKDLEWLLVSKATTQVYGIVVSGILEETVALADDIWYWDELLSSRRYTALYSLQTSPLRLWEWGSDVWQDVRARGGNFSFSGARRDATDSLSQSWSEFYGLVKQVVKERSLVELQRQAVGPVTKLRAEMRRKQSVLKKGRLRDANALGVLLGEGLANDSIHGSGFASPSAADAQHKWKAAVAHNVALMEAVLVKANDEETPVEKFDAAVAELTDEDPLFEAQVYREADEGAAVSVLPQAVAERLTRVLALAMPEYAKASRELATRHGKPSRLIRYWLPVAVGVLSSSTVLRIVVNRKAEILQWVQDLGATLIDFWRNWVIEPTRQVIKTIRHDEGSEVSIMSKRSLEGDRDSLERMVVDFAVDNPINATGTSAPLTEPQIADIRAKVREGDLTPVLKAYEKDLQSPFMGAARGNLIRALLIQIQKTKVDVEVAMGGIDSLLKSQELVFGFVGLTPGILVTYFLGSWIRSNLVEKRGSKAAQKQGKLVRQLRNIDRILTNSTPTDFGELFYKDQGLLLCEAHLLRQTAGHTMPSQIYREFVEEVEELVDVRTGIDKQRKVAERIRWAYARWF
ncbi:hypothetical protein MBLNU230_g4184t1 [Neophaeotheca triangularis]